MIQTEQTVITPHGEFVAMWDENEDIPVAYRGAKPAIDYFRAYLELNVVSGRNGALLDFDGLEPADLYGFCQSAEFGIVVLQDPDDLMADLEQEAQADE